MVAKSASGGKKPKGRTVGETLDAVGKRISVFVTALGIRFKDGPSFALKVVAIFFLAGMQLITVGVMGEYIGRIFDEEKRRPLYVVRRVSGHMAEERQQD